MTGTRAWRRAAVPTFAAACLAAGAAAQGWRDEQIREVGLQFRAPSYLERIPQRLGAEDGFVRARLEPKRKQDFVDDAYKWTVLVVEFEPQPAPEKPVRAKGVAGQLDAPPGPPPSFRAWLGQHKGLKIVTEGEPTRGQRGKLDYRHWVWKWEQYHGEAAVYDFDGREVALAIWMPTPRARGEEPPEKPSVKWSKLINSILKSGSAFEVEADADDDREDRQRDKFADTDERRAALERAKANIAGLEGWDYFTTPNYVVLYSWQSRTNSARNASKNDAKFYSSRLERMRELYAEHYPLDEAGRRAVMPDPKSIPEPKGSAGPITGRRSVKAAADDGEAGDGAAEAAAADVPPPDYPVLRFCATEAQFQKYGQSPRGVIGWFSPVSKELVVFLGGDERLGKGATEAVVYHEGWHQFADSYFGSAGSKQRDPLHRWFDEGHGDYFGSFDLARGRWHYQGSAMRGRTIEYLQKTGRVPSLEELVHWPRERFYGPTASQNYAVAYALVDFLRRGDRLRKHWKPIYASVLDDYKNVMLVFGDSQRATDVAFREFTAEDWRDLQQAWNEWVTSSYFKDG